MMDREASFYSKTPDEFNKKFKKGMEKEQANLWDAEFIKHSENQFFEFDEIEEVLETSDFQREQFATRRENFELFRSMIPVLEAEEVIDEKITLRMQSLVDYLYCLHGYYDWKDRLWARVSSFLYPR